MATNIEITSDLNKLLQKQNQLLLTQAKIQRSQLAVMQQLAAVFKAIDPGQFAAAMSEVDEAIKSAEKSTEKMGKSSQQVMGNFGKIGDKVGKSMGLVDDLNKKTFQWSVNLTRVSVKASAVEGAIRGFKAAHSVMTGLVSVTEGVVETFWNLTTAIVAIPFKILGALFDNAIQGGSEYRRLLEEIRKEFGDLTKNSAKAVVALGRSMKGELAETGLSVWRVFGNLVERTQALFNAAKALGNTFNLLRDSILENSEVFAAYYKGLGVSDEAFKALGIRATAAGRSIQDIGREMVQFADSMGEAFGINTREITKDVGEMMKDIHNFGNLSVQQLSQVSVYARRLGIEFTKLTGVVDAFDNFEKAAEGAAQLAQAFGLNVDAVKLVQEQDPAARFEMLRKSFFATGRSVEAMTRQEMRLLAAQTGLDEETLKLGFSLKSQSLSYAQVQKQGEAARKKTLTQEEAMVKLSGSIDRLVKDGQQLQGGLFSRFIQGFLKGIQLSQPFRRMMLEIARSLRIVYQAGRQVGRIFVEMFPGVKNVFEAIRDIFNADRFRKSMREVVDAFRQFFKGLTTDPASSLKSLMDRLKKAFFDYFDDSSGAGRKLLNGFKDFFSTVLKVGAAGLRIGVKGLIQIIRGLIDFIRDPSSLTKAASGTGGGIIATILEMFDPLIDAIVELGPPLWEAFSELLGVLGTKAVDWFKDHSGPIIKGLGTVFALYISSSLIGAVASGVVAGAAQKAGMALVTLMGGSLSRIRGAGRGMGGPGAGAMRGITEGTRGASGVAGAGRELAAKGAGINWGMLATILAGVAIVAAGIFLLALAVKRHNVPISDVLTATAIMGAATILVAALGGLMFEMTALSKFAAGAPAALPAVVGTFALGAAVAGGMFLLVKALGDINENQVLRASIAMLAGIGIMAALGALLAELIVVGALAGTVGLIAVAGVIGAFALGVAIAEGMPSLLKAVNRLSESAMTRAASIITSMVVVLGSMGILVAGLATLGAALVLSGGLGDLAILAGIHTLTQVTKAMIGATKDLIANVSAIPTEDGFKDRFEMFIQSVGAITEFGGMIVQLGSATSAGWLDTLTGNADIQVRNLNALKGVISSIQTSLVGVIGAVTDAVNSIEGGDAALNRASAISSVVSALSNMVSGLVPAPDSPFWEDSTWNGIDDVRGRLSQFSSTITLMLGSLRSLVGGVVAELSTPEFVGATAALGSAGGSKALEGIVSVFQIIGLLANTLSGTVLRNLKGVESTEIGRLIENAGSFIREMMGSLLGGGLLTNVSDMISSIVSQLSGLKNDQINRVVRVSPLLTAIFDAIAGVGNAVSFASELSSSFSEADQRAGALESINAFVSGIFTQLGTLVQTAIPTILESFRGLKAGDISRIKGGAAVLQTVFSTISTVTSSLQPLYELARTAGGGGTDFESVRNGLGTVFSLFWDSGEYEGLPTMLNRVAESFSSVNVSGFRSTSNAIKAMVTQVNAVASSFRRLNDSPMNITSELKKLASNLGVGSTDSFTIRHESFNVTINVEVKLLIEELEEAIKNRPGGSKFTFSAT